MSHPSYLQMILRAVISSRDSGRGIARPTITSYIQTNYEGLSEGSRFEAAVTKGLQKAIDQGSLKLGDKRCKGNNARYKIAVSGSSNYSNSVDDLASYSSKKKKYTEIFTESSEDEDEYESSVGDEHEYEYEDEDEDEHSSNRYYSSKQWDDTQLKKLSKNDVKQLLIARDEDEDDLKMNKADLIQLLSNKYHVDPRIDCNCDWESFTNNQLILELRLRGLKDSRANKQELIDRLNGSITTKKKKSQNKKASVKTAESKEYQQMNDNKNTIIHNNINIVNNNNNKAKNKNNNANKSKYEWNETECANWVGSLGNDYKKYKNKFKSSGINGKFMDEKMDDDTLEDIVKSKLHRKKILHEWEEL